MSSPEISVLLENCGDLCEGPHWDDATQRLLWMDCMRNHLHLLDPESGKDHKYEFDNIVGAGVPREKGGSVVVITGQNFKFLDLETGKQEIVATVDGDRPHNRFNDGKCDPAGRFWGGTRGVKDGEIIPKQGRLYSMDCDKTVRAHMDEVTISNGLAWSLDKKTLYYVDSIPRTVYAFDYDMSSGTVSNRRTAIQLDPQTSGVPDGMTIDEDGMLWIAIWGGGKVIRFNPSTGQEISALDVPVTRVTSCCWTGPNYDELIVTTAKDDLTVEKLKDQPLAGSIFRVKNLGTKGFPAMTYHG